LLNANANKNAVADARVIGEALSRPTIRCELFEGTEQQTILSVHRVRQVAVWTRAAQPNPSRRILDKFGQIMPCSAGHVVERRMAKKQSANPIRDCGTSRSKRPGICYYFVVVARIDALEALAPIISVRNFCRSLAGAFATYTTSSPCTGNRLA
jgi:hypothetical protein